MYERNSKGASTEPCGPPDKTGQESLHFALCSTLCVICSIEILLSITAIFHLFHSVITYSKAFYVAPCQRLQQSLGREHQYAHHYSNT